ncbi:MAG: CHAD domain-containing protein [Myxococcota bacterium]
MEPTPPNFEIELKLEVPAEDLPRLQRHARIRSLTQGRATTRELRSTYFDTAGLDLRRRGIALRVRKVGRVWLQTVKTAGVVHAGLFERAEHEVTLPSDRPDVTRIPDAELRAAIEREIGGRTLQPVVETQLRRTQRRVRFAGSELQLALDVGEIRTRSGSAPVRELELELVSGRSAALFGLALGLQADLDLRPSIESKVARGYALLTGERPSPAMAPAISLRPEATLEDVLAAVVGTCVQQIQANQVPAHDGIDPEGVHQMRVGVRRLRSALSLFAPMLPLEQAEPFRQELRWLAAELGAARDIDVFLEETLEPLLRHRPDDPALKRLRDEALELRADAYRNLRAALDSPRYPRLQLQLGGWLAARAWREQPLSAEGAILFAPAREQTAALLGRRHRKAHELGHDIATGTVEEQHRLRVHLKKLRYGAEFLRSVHPRADARRYLRRLARLQDVLGRLNDVATAERLLYQLLERLGDEAGIAHHRAAGYVAGWTARLAESHGLRLAKRWKAFEKAEPFWEDA